MNKRDPVLPGINRGRYEVTSSHRFNVVWVILIGVVVVGLLGVLIWYVLRAEGDDPFPPPPDTVGNPFTSTIGASDNGVVKDKNGDFYTDAVACRKGPSRRWGYKTESAAPVCMCVAPFFGSSCDRESYSDKYTAIGDPAADAINTTVISQQSVDRMSFPLSSPDQEDSNMSHTLCTGLCDSDVTCIGVIYRQGAPPDFGIGSLEKPECELLSGNVKVIPNNNIPYSIDKDSTLYLKQEQLTGAGAIQFLDRVFMYKGQLPLRYWLTDRYSENEGGIRTWAGYNGAQYNLDFIPSNVVNDANFTGVFANEEIPLSNLKEIIEGGTTSKYIIVPPGQSEISLPSSWTRPYVVWTDADSLGVAMTVSLPESSTPGVVSIRSRTRGVSKRKHIIDWNRGEDLSDIAIKAGDVLVFKATDKLFHGLTVIYKGKDRSYPVSSNLRQEITFKNKGTYTVKDRIYPSTMTMLVQVT